MPPLLPSLSLPALYLDRLASLLREGERTILGIVGSPGSGKSTLASVLQQQFPDMIQVVPMDGFHLSNSELRRQGLAHRKGAEDTFDSHGYVSLLARLRENHGKHTVYAPEFLREIDEPLANSIAVLPSTRLVIAEGNYLLLPDGAWGGVRGCLDEAWFVEVDAQQRREQLIQRHRFFGRSLQSAMDWVEHTDEPNARLIENTKARADLIFNWT